MTEYLAFLRAVNVGRRTVKMERLRASLEALGLDDVGTYINSGNVWFRSRRSARPALATAIEARLAEDFGFDVPVALRTVDEVEAVAAGDPFAGVEVTEHTRLCVAFAVAEPVAVDLPCVSPKGDVEILDVTGPDAFVVLRQQPGRPVNAGPFLERALGVPSTTRFFHTTAKIAAAARAGLGS